MLSQFPNRKSLRLSGYDYSADGGYFITICTHNRHLLFGEIVESTMKINALGMIVMEEWLRSGLIRRECVLDEFVVMPNHIHGIVLITGAQGPPFAQTPNPIVGAQSLAPLRRRPRSVGTLVAGYKSAVTTRYKQQFGPHANPIWQRSYYDHVIRNERDLNAIREYIRNNPLQWALDKENPNP